VDLVPDEIVTSQVRRTVPDLVRYVLGAALGIVILILLFGKRGELVAAWHQLGHVDPGWVAAAVCAESMSVWTYAVLQRQVLRLSGASIALPALFLLGLANDAIANTVPGEPAVSSAYRYRFYRRHGVSPASAGWTIFTILISQAIGMSALLLAGVVVALAVSTTSGGAGIAVVGLVIIVAAGALLIHRDLVLRLAGSAARWLHQVTRRPDGGITSRVEATLARMREIPLRPATAVRIVFIAAAVWGWDLVCLICSCSAVHEAIPWHGMLLAYGAAQVLAAFPVVPGGVGVVEGGLAVILIAYGASRVPALSATLVFRAVSFWLFIVVGWASVGVIAQRERRRRHPALAAAAVAAAPVDGAVVAAAPVDGADTRPAPN
jgi:uncharacterized protein (TIRG00374 family)